MPPMQHTTFGIAASILLAAPLAAQVTPVPATPTGPGGPATPTVGPRFVDGPHEVAGVEISPEELGFGGVNVGGASLTQTVKISNIGTSVEFVSDVGLAGAGAPDFLLTGVPAGGFTLRPGASKSFQVGFAPTGKGLLEANIEATVGSGRDESVKSAALRGHGLGDPGDEVRIDLGGAGLVTGGGVEWSPSYGADGAAVGSTAAAIAGTDDDGLYQAFVSSSALQINLPIPAGYYEVRLQLVEPEFTGPGQRIFGVTHEGYPGLFNVDPYAIAGGANAAGEVSMLSLVTDGELNLDFIGFVGEPLLAGIEVVSVPLLDADPGVLDFGAVEAGASAASTVYLTNFGGVDLTVDDLSILLGQGSDASGYAITFDGQTFTGSPSDQTFAVAGVLQPGETRALDVEFTPQTESFEYATLRIDGNFGSESIDVSGLGGHVGHPFLHVVIDSPALLVDFDTDGAEPVLLDGTTSHTHEPGKTLIGFDWYVNGQFSASGMTAPVLLPIGESLVELEIFDSNTPADSLRNGVSVRVVSPDAVPGVLAEYFSFAGGDPIAAIGGPLGKSVHAEVLEGFSVNDSGAIGSSELTADAVVRLTAAIDVPVADTYDFPLSGGAARSLWVDDVLWTGAQQLGVGGHVLRAEFAVSSLPDLPLEVTMTIGGGPNTGVPHEWVTHDESLIPPTINGMPTEGTSLGGNEIAISGLGFFPADQVVVHWGNSALTQANFTSISPNLIVFNSPPGQGTVDVTVETPNGISNVRQFEYDVSGPVPINFVDIGQVILTGQPTAADWGPDGLYYVALRDGRIARISFDDDYVATAVEYFPGVSGLTNHEIMGLAFNPYDAPSPVTVYVSHNELFADGGSAVPQGTYSEYPGAVSSLSGPNFDTPVPLITNLPTSNHDHAVNGLLFDHNGDLLISVGSHTNAGIKHPNSGDLPESPLSAAIVKAHTSRPDFNGALSYVESDTGVVNNNQVFGGIVDLAPGTHVDVHAAGLRNAFGLSLHTNGRVYVTDNGANFGFGAASTGADTDVGDPYGPDEVNLIEPGNYYGSPNRNRGRYDERQDIYQHPVDDAAIPSTYSAPLADIPSSMNGVVEFRSDVFGGQMRGDLITQKWANTCYRIVLSPDGRGVEQFLQIFPWTGALTPQLGPGGTLITINHFNQAVHVLRPDDLSATGLKVHDITPWRAPATGGTRFELAGVGFGSLANTAVTIGGQSAQLTSVSPTRIVGTVPAQPAPTTDLLDVVVTVNGQSDTHYNAFRYLLGIGNEPGFWESGPDVPMTVGDVAAGVVGDQLYLVGDFDARTAIYDLSAETWSLDGTARPFPGRDHGAEVIDGKLYLIGGLGSGSEGQVQIYDPATGQWSQGAPMPWAGGSVSTCVIDGRIYAAGGIVAGVTVDNFARYDPSFDLWVTLAPLPAGWGRNNAAAGTDGERLFIFGGRSGGDVVDAGHDDVFIYDSNTSQWSSSLEPGSSIPALPEPRGGMGRAVYRGGKFFVMGGGTSTISSETPNGAYARVDVYDPVEQTWKRDADLPTARQGIWPVLYESRIFVPGGGLVSGSSNSNVLELFNKN